MSQKQPYTPGEFPFYYLNIGVYGLRLLSSCYFTMGDPMAFSSRVSKYQYLKSRRKTTIRNLEVCFGHLKKYSNKQNKFL